MTVPMMPILTAAIAGAVDGAVVKNDADSGRIETTKQYATWYEAALLAGGIFLGMSGSYQFAHYAEPLAGAGAALLGSRLTQWALKQQSAAPMSAYGAGIPRGVYAAPLQAAGSVHKQPSMTLV